MVTSDTLDFDDIQPNDLNLLLKNLASVVSEPRHLDVYRLGYRLFRLFKISHSLSRIYYNISELRVTYSKTRF